MFSLPAIDPEKAVYVCLFITYKDVCSHWQNQTVLSILIVNAKDTVWIL